MAFTLPTIYFSDDYIGGNPLFVDPAATNTAIAGGVGISTNKGPTQALGFQIPTSVGLLQYGVAGATITAGDLVMFYVDSTYSPSSPNAAKDATTALVGSTPTSLGVALSSMTAGQFGWFWVGFGNWQVLTTTGITAGTALTTHTVAGTASTGGTAIGAQAIVATTTAGLSQIAAPGLLKVNA